MWRFVVVGMLVGGCHQTNAPKLGSPTDDATVPDDGANNLVADAVADAPVDAMPDAPPPPTNLTGSYTYLKASNPGADDWFGEAVAISADGNTIAVGAPFEQSNATGIDGDQTDNSLEKAGAVYVFTRTSSGWVQQAYVKPSNTNNVYRFGYSLALTQDGSLLVVGAWGEQSCATGVNNTSTLSCGSAGAAYTFARTNGVWAQQAYLKSSNTTAGGYGGAFGQSLALTPDGKTLAVGAPGESSNAQGINGNQVNASATGSGAVYVFTRAGTAWTQQAYVKASNASQNDNFGFTVSLSSDGSILAVGAPEECSGATGVGGSQLDDSVLDAGAAYTFKRTNGSWSQTAYIKASNTGQLDEFGKQVALSSSGTVLAISSYGESSAATGVDGDQTDNSQLQAGAVYLFAPSGSAWTQTHYVKSATSQNGDRFGISLAVSGDGTSFTAGCSGDKRGGTGLDPPLSTTASDSGAVYLFRASPTWAQHDYAKASNTDAGDIFGIAIAQTPTAGVVVVGAVNEDSAASGVGGDQTDNSLSASGAVYIVE